jgi:hypothetical protein
VPSHQSEIPLLKLQKILLWCECRIVGIASQSSHAVAAAVAPTITPTIAGIVLR